MNKGLLPLPKDKRDRSHHLTFGTPTTSLPNEYIVDPIDIDNQFATQFCTAFASSEIAESQFNVKLSPEFTAAKEGQLAGYNIAGHGMDLRTAMKTGVKFGFLPQNEAPYSLLNASEQECGDWTKWATSLDLIAAKYKMDGYYAVDGALDTFSNIKNALWAASQDQQDNKRTILCGTKWYLEFEQIGRNGIIPEKYSNLVSLHAHRIIGWKTINGKEYLIDQQEQGRDYGDNGLCYFPRAVVNDIFTEGLFIFRKNPDPSEIRTISTMLGLISKLVGLWKRLYFGLKGR